ncbi:Hypothetical protein MVR_LOCUS221 [uncultured virus]|nr:Hypothetical protein MVR_LOCUS221 [uncultured virus]
MNLNDSQFIIDFQADTTTFAQQAIASQHHTKLVQKLHKQLMRLLLHHDNINGYIVPSIINLAYTTNHINLVVHPSIVIKHLNTTTKHHLKTLLTPSIATLIKPITTQDIIDLKQLITAIDNQTIAQVSDLLIKEAINHNTYQRFQSLDILKDTLTHAPLKAINTKKIKSIKSQL